MILNFCHPGMILNFCHPGMILNFCHPGMILSRDLFLIFLYYNNAKK